MHIDGVSAYSPLLSAYETNIGGSQRRTAGSFTHWMRWSNRGDDHTKPVCLTNADKIQIQQALDKCKIASDQSEYASLGDSGYTVTLQGRPEYSQAGLPVTDIACILKAIKIPDSVVSEIDSTRALDGTQKDSWGKFQASWTYHPKNGVRIILTESKSGLPN